LHRVEVRRYDFERRLVLRENAIYKKSSTKAPKLLSAALASVLVLAGTAFPQAPSNIEVTKLKDGFFRLTWKIPYAANFPAFVRPEGILLVDSGQKWLTPMTRKIFF